MSTLSELFVRISGDNSSFKKSMKDSGDDMLGFESMVSAASGRIAGYLSATAIAGGIFKASEVFEKAGIQIQRSTGATGAQLEGLEKSFKSLYVGSAQSGEAISAAMVKITQKTGATGAQLEALTKSALNFSKVTGSDLVSSVATNEKVFSAWGITVQGQALALDALYVASQKAGIGAEQISQSMLTLGPALRNIGFSFNESVALISSFEKAGLNADEMVMGLNVAFAKFAAAGKDPKQALLDLIEHMGTAANRATALGLAVDAGFTVRTAGKFVDAVKSGAFQLSDLIGWLGKSSGAVDEMAKKTDTLGEVLTKLWHVTEAGIEQSGMIKWLTEGISGWNTLVERVGLYSALTKDVGLSAAQRNANYQADFGPRNAATALLKSDLALPGIGTLPTGVLGGNGAADPTASTATDKTRPWDQMSDSLAVLVASYHEAIAAHKSTIEEMAKSDLTIPAYWENLKYGAIQSAKAFDDLGNAVAPQKSIFDGLAPSIDKLDKLMKELGVDLTKSAQADLANSTFGQLASAAEHFGITTAHTYDLIAEDSVAAFDKMLKSGLATDNELAVAALKTAQAEIDADHALGKMSDARYAEDSKAIAADLALYTGAEKKKASLSEQIATETKRLTSQMFNSLERGIASDIVHWKGFATTIKDIFTTLGEDVLTMMLHALLKPLEVLLAGVLAKVAEKVLSLFGVTQKSAAQTAAGQIADDAAVGGANVAAWTAAIPFVGPALAIEAGLAMSALIAGTFGGVLAAGNAITASAAGGFGTIPHDMDLSVHKDEMVLPADIGIPLRASLRGGGQVGSGGIQIHIGNMYGVAKETVDLIASQIIRQGRLAGARV